MDDQEFMLYWDGSKHKPLYRGLIHSLLLQSSPCWGFLILAGCQTWTAFWSAVLYLVASVFCYFVSSCYHRLQMTWIEEVLFAKLDGFAIYVMMAFNSAPVFMLMIPTVGYPIMAFLTLCCLLVSYSHVIHLRTWVVVV